MENNWKAILFGAGILGIAIILASMTLAMALNNIGKELASRNNIEYSLCHNALNHNARTGDYCER